MGAWEADYTAWLEARTAAMLRYAHMLTGDPHEAEDLLHDVLIRVAARWSVARRDQPDAYVRKALTNAAINRSQRRKEYPAAQLPERTARDAVGAVPLRLDVRDALTELPPRQRAAVALRYYEDYTEAMIADALGCSVGTVKSQLAKANVRLRELLGTYHPHHMGDEQ